MPPIRPNAALGASCSSGLSALTIKSNASGHPSNPSCPRPRNCVNLSWSQTTSDYSELLARAAMLHPLALCTKGSVLREEEKSIWNHPSKASRRNVFLKKGRTCAIPERFFEQFLAGLVLQNQPQILATHAEALPVLRQQKTDRFPPSPPLSLPIP
ncbi:unnamed protein product [Cyclocybe aegerita]|uniref:Uncharacterized protein n=1 Tax=Cyclocybe aegerita TaxID=1973307 RepID=A0A8S0XK26_CYCAE|nr:unnamed protein product [Cyclocybe aegerita]